MIHVVITSRTEPRRCRARVSQPQTSLSATGITAGRFNSVNIIFGAAWTSGQVLWAGDLAWGKSSEVSALPARRFPAVVGARIVSAAHAASWSRV